MADARCPYPRRRPRDCRIPGAEDRADAPPAREPGRTLSEDELVERLIAEFDAREVTDDEAAGA